MNKLIPIASLCWFLSAPMAKAQALAQNIPIQNPSFEQISANAPSMDRCGTYVAGIPGWQLVGNGGIFQPYSPDPCLRASPVDGMKVAYLFDQLGKPATIFQDTGMKASDLQVVSRDGLYAMMFYVAGYSTVYPGYYEAAILLGQIDSSTGVVTANELCSADGWSTWSFKQVTLSCPSPGFLVFDQWPGWGNYAPFDPNAHIIISLSAQDKGWPVLFDNVSLTFTPQ